MPFRFKNLNTLVYKICAIFNKYDFCENKFNMRQEPMLGIEGFKKIFWFPPYLSKIDDYSDLKF